MRRVICWSSTKSVNTARFKPFVSLSVDCRRIASVVRTATTHIRMLPPTVSCDDSTTEVLVPISIRCRHFSYQARPDESLVTDHHLNLSSGTKKMFPPNLSSDRADDDHATLDFNSNSYSVMSQCQQAHDNEKQRERNFDEAMKVLRSLQSNRAAIQKSTLSSEETQRYKLQSNKEMMHLIGISTEDIKAMNIVHVAGTKGKGSTCAMIESLLRNQGYCTGLFTSPHILTVRERIRLNGRSIDESKFSQYFWEVYDRLQPHLHKFDNLFYFGFMTLMALHVFKREQVNAVILEVGIGGEYDTTNIIDYPLVTVVTSLGLDHVQLLGNKIEQIAWHKSGIFRPNVPAFTAQNQEASALNVLMNRAEERSCTLLICPPFEKYSSNQNNIELGLDGPVQQLNASLALQVSRYFVNTVQRSPNCKQTCKEECKAEASPTVDAFELNEAELKGLKECQFAGRFEIVKVDENTKLFVDGAHTVESLEHCANWFESQTKFLKEQKKELVFFCTGDRKPSVLLPVLNKLNFDVVHFAPHPLTKDLIWDGMSESINEMKKVYEQMKPNSDIRTYECLSDCFSVVMSKPIESNRSVLLTGSFYLIGNWYRLLNKQIDN